MIRARFHIGAKEKERRRSSSFTSSSGFSPTSLTNPPRGKTEIWYWVSPNFLPISFGPNPNEKVRTPMPNLLASKKWPSSWTKTRIPKTMTVDSMVVNTIFPFLR